MRQTRRRRVVPHAFSSLGDPGTLSRLIVASWPRRLLASLVVILLATLGFGPVGASADTSCQGFGSGTPGGPAGTVYRVTNTFDQGPGSLRDAVSQGNRTVVFDVGGWFSVDTDIVVGGPFITIDGTTAPTAVLLVHHGLVVSGTAGAHDIIIKDLRIRNAEGPAAIAIADGAYNVVVEQVAIQAASGGSLDISNSHDVTVCWSLLASPVDHNMTIGSGSARVSLHNNVFVGAVTGSPAVGIDAAGTPATETTLDMFSNIVSGWGTGWGTLISNGAAANVVGNLFSSPGSPPDAQADALIVCHDNSCTGGAATNARAYVEGNVADGGVNVNGESTEAQPFAAPAVAAANACQAAYATVANAGVRPLDTIDRGSLDAVILPSACVADLVAESVTVPEAATAGSSITVTDVTKNQGSGQAGPSTTQFYFSSRNYLDDTAVPVATRTVPALAAGATDSGSKSLTIPAAAGALCTYYILAEVDSEDVNPESDKGNNVTAQTIKICPDLLVNTIEGPDSATAGTTIDVSDTVSNRGQSGAPATTVKLYLSTLSTLDGTAVPIGDRPVPALAAGATSTATTSVTIPASAGAAGLYYVIAVVDPDNTVGEYDEGNNHDKWVKVKIGPDLHISAISAPTSATPGTAIDVTETTRNRGVSGAGASVTKFFLGTSATFDATATLLGSRNVPILAAGAIDTATTSVTIPASAGAAGTYYLFAVADGAAQIVEPDETNNTNYAVVKIGPDLHISGAITAPASAVAGTAIDVTETTRNRGVSGAGASVTKFFLGTSATFDATATLLGSRGVPALAAGAIDTATTSVTIPASAGAAGTYYLFAVADGAAQIVEPDETNNTNYAVVKIGPDLHISGAITAPASAVAGTAIDVTETTRNRGVSGAGASVTKFFLGTSATFDATATLLGSRNVPVLAAGAIDTATTSVTIPTSAGAAGTYYLFAVADGAAQIVEPDETNNTNYAVVKIGPDLHISGAISAPTTAVAGTAIDVTETTRNRGVSGAGASVTKFFLGTSATFDATATLLGSRNVPILAAGAIDTATTSVTIPASAGAAGTYYLFAVADGAAQIVEPDETNNTNYAVVKIGPDLDISAISAPTSATPGTAIDVTETTRNRGVSGAGASVTKFFLGTSATFDATATLLGSRDVPILAAGAIDTATTSVTIPASAGAAGTYYLFAVADGAAQIVEPDETNNTNYAVVKIGPDLHISAISAPTSATPGTAIDVTETTRNRGVSGAGASVTKFFLGTSATFDATATLLGSRDVPILAAGAIDTATTSVTIPASAGAAGTYYLFAVADGAAQTVEPDETNNTNYAVVKIGPDLDISAISAPTSATPGTAIDVTETTRNRGVSGAGTSVTKFFLGTSATFDATATLLGSRGVPILAAGAIDTATTSVTIPASAGAAGTYYLFAVADGAAQIVEPDETNNANYAVVKIGPDLHISAISAPTSATPGTAIDVTETTRNRGVSGAGASVTKFFLGTSATFDATATLLGSRGVPILAAGAIDTATTSVTIPASAGAAGTYYLFAVADGAAQIVEPDETNNANYAVVKIGPDFVVTVVNGPSSAAPGATITVADTTTNRGTAGAPPSVTRYYLSMSTTFNPAAALFIGSRNIPALAPGASHTGSSTASIPSNGPGYPYLLAVANAAREVGEPDPTNNAFYAPINIGPDLIVTGVNGPSTGNPGGSVTFTDGTKNRGVSAAPTTVTRFYLSMSPTPDASAIVIGSRKVPILAAGATSTVSTTVTLPAGIGGTFYVLAMADADNQVLELNETNDYMASTSIKIGPDLTITGISGPSNGAPGGTILVSEGTKNNGVSPTPGSTTKFYLSTSSAYGPGATLIGSRGVPALAAGATSSVSISLTLPNGIAGLYYLFAVADADNQVAELNETNNVGSTTVTIGPDLIVTSVSAPTYVAPGATITVTDATKNKGASTAGVTITKFFLSTSASIDSGAILLGSRAVPALAAGATSTGSASLTIPASATASSYYIVALADADSTIVEQGETNNTAAALVRMGADLALSGLSAPATALAGNTIVVTETTRNRGFARAGASVTRFHISGQTVLDGSAIPLGVRAVPALAAGEASMVSTTFTLPAGLGQLGQYYILVVADADNTVPEIDESNNGSYAAIKIGPDLTIAPSSLIAPATAIAGTSIQVSETTRNRGTGPAAESETRLYLSASPTLDATALLLDARKVPTLAAGANSVAPRSVTIPVTVGASGTYYLFAVADATSRLIETDETNNAMYAIIKIGPDLVVDSISGPSIANPGDTVSLTWGVRNRGAAPAAASTIVFYLATQKTYDPVDAVQLGTRSVPSLAAGVINSGSITATLPSVAPGRTYYILAIADGQGAVVETSEDNNQKYWPVSIP